MPTAASSAPGAAPGGGSGAAPDAGPGSGFEETLARLETLVTRLESGDLPLDEALRTFELGVRLTRECQAALGAAQQKVQLLLQRGEAVVLEEFDTASIERVSIGAADAGTVAAPELSGGVESDF